MGRGKVEGEGLWDPQGMQAEEERKQASAGIPLQSSKWGRAIGSVEQIEKSGPAGILCAFLACGGLAVGGGELEGEDLLESIGLEVGRAAVNVVLQSWARDSRFGFGGEGGSDEVGLPVSLPFCSQLSVLFPVNSLLVLEARRAGW